MQTAMYGEGYVSLWVCFCLKGPIYFVGVHLINKPLKYQILNKSQINSF